MMRRTAKDGTHAVNVRLPLLWTAAIVTFVTAIVGLWPVLAQSVTGSGVNPSSIVSPDWPVGSDLQVGTSSGGALNITGGGTVTNDTGFIGNGTLEQGTVTVTGHDVSGNASAWNAANNVYVGFSGNGTLAIADEAAVATSAAGGGAASVYIGYMNGSMGRAQRLELHWQRLKFDRNRPHRSR